MKKETNQQGHSWKTSDWVLTKSSIIVEGTVCDEYQNQITSQIVYEGKINNKEIVYDKAVTTDPFGKISCPSSGNNCKIVNIDGARAYLIKDGASTN
ncbi:MAG: hypothetical protein HPY79_08905 [Bacteroidales bacterium]|nr:hypothetical protein [Bacteroidales bacterium]